MPLLDKAFLLVEVSLSGAQAKPSVQQARRPRNTMLCAPTGSMFMSWTGKAKQSKERQRKNRHYNREP